MRALRLIFAGLIAVTALVAGFFAAAVILVAGLVAYFLQLFWNRKQATRSGSARTRSRQPSMRTGDVIDVVATKIPTDQSEH